MGITVALRQAWRSLSREPLLSLVVLGILAVGIATTVAVYSIVAAVLLRPLPYEAADRLVVIRQVDEREGYEYGASGPSVRDWRESATTLEALAATSGPGQVTLTGAGEPIRVSWTAATADFFVVLGARAAVGRLLVRSDGAAGAPGVAVLSDGLWKSRFGGDPGVLGDVITLDGEPYEVVGVTGADVDLPQGTEVWTVMPPDADYLEIRYAHILGAFGRLAPGVAPSAAQEELNAILARVPGYEVRARVVGFEDRLVGEVRTPLLILMGAVAFVLLIACANVGTLLLARSARRRREMAIRGALGAGSGRLAVQLLAESLLLALAAGLMGVVLATWLLDALMALAPRDLPRMTEVGIDAGILGFGLAASLATGLLTGLIPTIRAARVVPVIELKDGGARSGGRTGRARSAFVVAEVALSVVLLFGAGLLLKSFLGIVAIDPGFRTADVTTFEFSLPGYRYAEDADVRRFQAELLEGVRSLPGVSGAAVARNLPVAGTDMVTPALLEDREVRNPPRVQIASVSEDYIETLGLSLVSGRGFRSSDDAAAPPVAVVNQAFADAYYDGVDPVGRRARTYFGEPVMREIVGVVGTTIHGALTETPQPKFYYPAAQMPSRSFRLAVRSEASTAALVPGVRAVVRRVDADIPLGDIATMRELLARTTAQPRFYATVLGVFAALALLLALTGFFAVLSQSVTQRRREMGIRLAVGAAPAEIVRLVVGQGMALTAAGLITGALGGLAAARLLRSLLVGISPSDPSVLLGVGLLLGAAALTAAWIPARQAAATDPTVTLRSE